MNDRTLKSMEDSANGLASEARETADRMATRGRNAANELKEGVKEGVEDLKAEARKGGKRAREELAAQTEEAANMVRRNPFMGMGIAFVAGAVIYALVRR
jgi:ElaB/YqjD/DUF883 family membrane-anchored ribosome-binding protein